LPVLSVLSPEKLFAACLERALSVAALASQDLLGLRPVVGGVAGDVITFYTVGVGIECVCNVDPNIRGVHRGGRPAEVLILEIKLETVQLRLFNRFTGLKYNTPMVVVQVDWFWHIEVQTLL